MQNRFLEALNSATPSLENQALWRGTHSVVLPTLGMIVPNWFLIVPYLHTLNFAQQPAAAQVEIPILASMIFDAVGVGDDDLLVFEHGAQNVGSPVGCGLDHAHVHVLVASTSFVNAVWSAMETALQTSSTDMALAGLHHGVEVNQSYYLAWRRSRRLVEQPAVDGLSQRFRRLVASTAGVPNHWDYRTHPCRENITKTVEAIHHRKPLAA
jgi:hypothetical protein